MVEVAPVQSGQQAKFHHDLEAVADPEHQFLGIDESLQVVAHPVANTLGQDLSGTHVIAVGESADEHHAGIIVECGTVGPSRS